MFLRIIQFGRARLSLSILTVLAMAGIILIWSAPAIIGSRMLWPRVVAYMTSDLEATVTTENATLRWFAPVVVRNVNVKTLSGVHVASIDAIETEATLLSLLWGGSDFGKVVIEQPELQLSLRSDGSNLEDILTAYLSGADSSSGAKGTIEINNGTLVVEAPLNHKIVPARFEAIGAVITLGDDKGKGGTVKVPSCRAAGGKSEGALTAAMAWRTAGESTDWSVATQIQSLDLSLLQPVMQRLNLAIDLSGIGNLDAKASWHDAAKRMTVELQQAGLRQVRVTAADYLGQDQLALEQVVASGTLSAANGTWQMTAAKFACDAGRVELDGQFAWPSIASSNTASSNTASSNTMGQLISTAKAADLKVTGQIDLARLAATMPRTLHIREGAVIESGTLDFALQGGSQAGGRQWTARVNTSALAARRDGKQITWNAPLQVTVEASQQADKWRVEQLACTSSFLSLTGQGTPAAGSFAMQCDLQQLSGQLREFVELGSLQAAGTMSSRLDWKRGADQRLTIHGTGLLENMELVNGTASQWREPRLSVTLSAEGEPGDQQATRLKTAQLELTSNADRLVLQLLEPVDSPISEAVWVVGGHLSGEWATWFPRLRPLLPASLSSHSWTMAGPLDLQLTSRVSRQSIEIQQGTLSSEPFLLDTPQLRINEPVVAIEVEGEWDFGTQHLRVPEATFQARAVAFRVTDLRMDPQEAGARTSGDITFRADLERLYQSWRVPAKQHNWKLTGSAQGQVSLVQVDNTTRAQWTLDVVGIELGRRRITAPTGNVLPATNVDAWTTVWSEPSLKATGSGECDLAAKTLAFDRFELSSADKLQLTMQGNVAEPIGACVVDLQGQITYDLSKLLHQWAPEWKRQVRWVGHDTQPFRLRGPLFQLASVSAGSTANSQTNSPSAVMIPPTLYGESGLSWQSADLFGITVGAGAVAATLETGTVHMGVIEIPISGGTVRLEPTVYLNHLPPVVAITPGQVLTNVQITAGMCDQWLKYIAPIAADATQAKGQFSLSLGQTAIPLSQPTAARGQGDLKIHTASIGPGPLAQALILTVNRLTSLLQLKLGDLTAASQNSWVRLPEQQTQFRIVDGRVHHDQLAFEVGGTMIYTRGSVGFDESLALVAQVPIRDQWIAKNPQLATLRGQFVQLPISGTLSNPRVDQRALERFATDTVRQATEKILQDELNKGLQRWLGPGK